MHAGPLWLIEKMIIESLVVGALGVMYSWHDGGANKQVLPPDASVTLQTATAKSGFTRALSTFVADMPGA
jgi:hypothetical protein